MNSPLHLHLVGAAYIASPLSRAHKLENEGNRISRGEENDPNVTDSLMPEIGTIG